ncbi:MAG: ROK family protein [Clostridiales bacterium]|nr:ROK family protein [Candidatus Cacconaster stercorequi]
MRYLGIDVGGTNLKGAVVTENGEILKEASCPTHADRGADAVADAISTLILDLTCGEEIVGVGVGCPGTVDDERGEVIYSCNLNWIHYPLREKLKERTGYTVKLGNDANVAALGEALVGAAKGAQSAVILTLGTGVGGGVVIDGKLLQGYTGAASELGHMVIVDGGRKCGCGRMGCFEAYASAEALSRMTREAMAQHPESQMHRLAADYGAVDGRVAFDAQAAGDAAGDAVVRQYIHYLAVGVANIVNLFFPEVIAISGGVAKQGERLLAPLRQEVSALEYGAAYTVKHPRIVGCTLGYQAGVIGAALLAK